MEMSRPSFLLLFISRDIMWTKVNRFYKLDRTSTIIYFPAISVQFEPVTACLQLTSQGLCYMLGHVNPPAAQIFLSFL